MPQASTQTCYVAPHDSSDAQAAPDKAAESAAAPLAAPSSSGTAQAGAQAGSEAAKAAETVAHGPTQLVQGPVLEGPVGQALAEATVEMVLAVLRSCEDSGQLHDLYFCAHASLTWHVTHMTLGHSSVFYSC